jgi:ubiquinone/menaquinone biosynthesis C-methylase UbiE
MSKEFNQTERFTSESFRYVSSYLNDQIRTDHVVRPGKISASEVFSVLDVGCGNGTFLRDYVDYYEADTGVGIEPSAEAISLLSDKWSDDKRLRFKTASAHKLPFDNDSFDLVTIWGVLCWVGRNEYLQALGELCRVTRKYLCIMDFVASEDYRVTYHHKEDMFTYKMDFETPVLASGIMRSIGERRWFVDPKSDNVIDLSYDDLKPFRGNPISYHSGKMVVFEKDYDRLPLLSKDDFDLVR